MSQAPTSSLRRAEWFGRAHNYVSVARTWVSPSSPHMLAPSSRSGPYGSGVDGLEGFARAGLAASFLIRAGGTADQSDEFAWLVDGLTAGVDTRRGDRWLDGSEHAQALAEAASISLIVRLLGDDLTRHLDDHARERLSEWLTAGLSRPIGDNNWHLFKAVIVSAAQGLTSDFKPEWREVRERSLARVDEWLDPHSGWFSDGGRRRYDYYNSFALHFYPVLDAWLARDEQSLAVAGQRTARHCESLAEWIDDGAPVAFGRSLTYRAAIAAAFGTAALAQPYSERAAAWGDEADSILRYFAADLSAPTPTLGWVRGRSVPGLVQHYSGPASPYWASKGFVGLLVPDDSSFWRECASGPDGPEMPRTVTGGPTGLLVQRNPARVTLLHNHGSDGGVPEDRSTAEWNLYSRLTYSTVTLPLAAEHLPAPDAVSVLGSGRRSTRGALLQAWDGAGWAASTSTWRVAPRAAAPTRRLTSRLLHRVLRRFRPVQEQGGIQACTVVVDGWAVTALRTKRLPHRGRVWVGAAPLLNAEPRGLRDLVGSDPLGRRLHSTLVPGPGLAPAPKVVEHAGSMWLAARTPRLRTGAEALVCFAAWLGRTAPSTPVPEIDVVDEQLVVVRGQRTHHRILLEAASVTVRKD